MRTRLGACLGALALLLLAGCGGGGGDGGSPGGAGLPASGFPTLVTSSSFRLPPIAEPPDHSVAAGFERGRVLTAAGVAAPAGTTVDVIDAANVSAPRVVASGPTDATGSFSIAADLSTVDPSARWLRVTMGGTVLRAFATGWTEVTLGSEAVVTELNRLRRAGRLPTPAVAALSTSQQLLTLMWLGGHAGLAPAQALPALLAEARTNAAWNRWLAGMESGSVGGPGDVAGLVPVTDVTWPSTVVRGHLAPTAVTIRSACSIGLAGDINNCGSGTATDPDLREAFIVDRLGVHLREDVTADLLSELLGQVGDLPLLEFPPAVGTRVLYDNSQFALQIDSGIHAAIRITRRTYPAEAVAALGASPQAVRVVLDYEVAVLNMRTGEQVDLLGREQRWFAPKAGRVRIEAQTLSRNGAQVATGSLSLTANSVGGVVFLAPTIPFAGVADAQAIGLRHHHAVHSAALERVYAASPDNGGTIVELDAATLAPLRTLGVGTVPRRLAVAPDGPRLFAGLDDGSVAEWSLPDFALVSRTAPMVDPYGVAIDRVFDLAIDPFDSRRVLALVGASTSSGRGAVVLFRDGNLLLRDAPRYDAFGWGWGYYGPYAVAWSSVPNEFFAPGMRSQNQLNRFAVGPSAFQELLVQDTGEDWGWTEVAGHLVMQSGAVRDASSLAELRTLGLPPLRLRDCARFDPASTLCRFRDEGSAPPSLLLMDHADGAFQGVFRPAVTTVSNGCPERGVREGSLGLDDLSLAPIGTGRVLASSLSAGSDGTERCNLQVWTLRGVVP